MSDTSVTSSPLDQALRRLMVFLDRHRDERGLSPGDRAELRRMDPVDGTLPPAFWRLITDPVVAAAIADTSGGDPERAERAFAVVIQAMAEAGTAGQRTVGTALAATGYAEERFVRFLRARGPALAEEAHHVARWCGAEAGGLRFADNGRAGNGFAPFVLDAYLGRGSARARAHAIARDYYRALARADTSPPNKDE